IMFGHEEIKKLIAFQEEIAAEVGKEKTEIQLYELDAELTETIKNTVEAKLNAAVQINEKQARNEAIDEVKKGVMEQYEESDDAVKKQAGQILDKMVKEEVRRLITDEKIRPDGRGPSEIRALSSEVGL